MKPRKLFTVKGSEDGMLGVYSNVKRAYTRAMQYLNQNGAVKCTVAFLTDDGKSIIEKPASYINVCKKLTDPGVAQIEAEDRVDATIERFYLNQ